MNKIKKTLLMIVTLFTTLTITAQSKVELKSMALKDAQAAMNATLKDDFKTLLTYTHPKILDAAGGAEVMEEYLSKTFTNMKENGFKYLVAKTKSASDVVEEQGEYRCYVENYNEMQMNGKKIISTSYMIGMYDKTEKKWKFVEAKEMKNSGAVAQYFPDFETNLKIPENTMDVSDL